MGKYSGKTCRLLTMLGMTGGFFLVEIIVGYITNSVALVADSFHMLSDVVALIVGFASVRIAKWRTQKNTFGWVRAEVLGALINTVFLIALCFSILVEALKRLVEVQKIENPKLLLIVGGTGLVINLLGLGLFHNHGHSHGGGGGGHGHSHGGSPVGNSHGHSHGRGQGDGATVSNGNVRHHAVATGENHALVENRVTSEYCEDDQNSEEVTIEIDDKHMANSSHLNMRAVFLHVLGDALGSVIVIISALVILFVEEEWIYYIDPAMSIVMVCIILSTTIPLFKETALILLQNVPTHIAVKEIKEKLEKMDGVLAVHEYHVWQLAANRVIASAHIRCHNPHDYMELAVKIKDLFHDEGIHSTTIQPEFADELEEFTNRDCVLACGPEKTCYPNTCCAVPQQKTPNKIEANGGNNSPAKRLSLEPADDGAPKEEDIV